MLRHCRHAKPSTKALHPIKHRADHRLKAANVAQVPNSEPEQPAPRAKRQRVLPARIASSVQPEPSRKRKTSKTPPQQPKQAKARPQGKSSDQLPAAGPHAAEPAGLKSVPERPAQAQATARMAAQASSQVKQAASQQPSASPQLPHTLAHLQQPVQVAPLAPVTQTDQTGSAESGQHAQHAQHGRHQAHHIPLQRRGGPQTQSAAGIALKQQLEALKGGNAGHAAAEPVSAAAVTQPDTLPAAKRQRASPSASQPSRAGDTSSAAEQPSQSASESSESASADPESSEHEDPSAEDSEPNRRGRGKGRGRGRGRGAGS